MKLEEILVEIDRDLIKGNFVSEKEMNDRKTAPALAGIFKDIKEKIKGIKDIKDIKEKNVSAAEVLKSAVETYVENLLPSHKILYLSPDHLPLPPDENTTYVSWNAGDKENFFYLRIFRFWGLAQRTLFPKLIEDIKTAAKKLHGKDCCVVIDLLQLEKMFDFGNMLLLVDLIKKELIGVKFYVLVSKPEVVSKSESVLFPACLRENYTKGFYTRVFVDAGDQKKLTSSVYDTYTYFRYKCEFEFFLKVKTGSYVDSKQISTIDVWEGYEIISFKPVVGEDLFQQYAKQLLIENPAIDIEKVNLSEWAFNISPFAELPDDYGANTLPDFQANTNALTNR